MSPRVFLAFALLMLLIAPLGRAEQEAPGFTIPLLSGIADSDGNADDPAPAESRHLRTRSAGFQLLQGLAGYVVVVEVKAPPTERWYTRAILENPEDPQAPFVYDHHLDPRNSTTTITHGPVKGLKFGQILQVQLILFRDPARTQEIERLDQDIRSHVETDGDSTHLEITVEKRSPRPEPDDEQETETVATRWRVTFDDRAWHPGSQSSDGSISVREWILEGETIEAWSELVSVLTAVGEVHLRNLYEQMTTLLAQNCPSFAQRLLTETEHEVEFEWHNEGCSGGPGEQELRRVFHWNGHTVALSYARKGAFLSDAEQEAWFERLRSAAPPRP